jgi:hypothetical protein
MYILLLREGQMGEAWEYCKKNSLFGKRVALNREQWSHFLVFKRITTCLVQEMWRVLSIIKISSNISYNGQTRMKLL